MAKVAQEKSRDEEARTTDIGLFNFAESYQKAADVLARSKARATHKAHVIQYLRYHAIELYLKAYLRGHGISVTELRSRRYGHDVGRLSAKCEALSLPLMDEDKEVFDMMANTDVVIQSRYLVTGPFTWPHPDALRRTCQGLRKSIVEFLQRKGHKKVRLQ